MKSTFRYYEQDWFKPDWYAVKSAEMKVPYRCPFASANRCPRYYQSFDLLSKTGMTTAKFPKGVKTKLHNQWKNFKAIIGEEPPSISGGPSPISKTMSNFCPEVSYNIFGVFASKLIPHDGDEGRMRMMRFLAEENIPISDSRADWECVTIRHYTDCPEYSILSEKGTTMNEQENNEKASEKMVFHIGSVHGPVGHVSHSPVAFYDNKTVNQLFVEKNIPKQDRRELEDIMDELKTAEPAKKKSLAARAEELIVKHKEALGATAEIIVKSLKAALE